MQNQQPQPESKMQIKSRIVAKIVAGIKGKNVEARRIKALQDAGFQTSFEGVKFNFGRAGTTKEDGKDILVQIKYAKGGRAKNGFTFNRCEVYRVK
jgi:hypothetical protein